jgi:hypothetical protein
MASVPQVEELLDRLHGERPGVPRLLGANCVQTS